MPAAARADGVDSVDSPDGTGDKCLSPTTQATDTGSGDVFINGHGAIRLLTDSCTPHSGPGCVTHAPVLTSASPNVYVNGKGAGRKDDQYAAHVITTGSGDVFING
jgi:uncharacterized Zn-binding protein involved in type VI secretion